MISFKATRPGVHLGYIPTFLDEADPRPAAEQIRDRYVGGWHPFHGMTMTERGLEYPGDTPMLLLAETKLRDETIRVYQHDWVAIIQADGSFEVSCLD